VHVIEAFYQLGLIAQWQQDNDRAQELYRKLMELAKDGFVETVALVKARMAEIEKKQPLEFNIKTLLDATLKPQNSQAAMAGVDIIPSAYNAAPKEEITISASTIPPESGCMQVQMQYYWSGDLGSGRCGNDSSFTTSYSTAGTKVIGVVVMTPGGTLDRGLVLIDIE